MSPRRWDGTVDPTVPDRRPARTPSRTVLAGLLLEVKPLAPLGGWQPVGARLEALVDAARGEGGITRPEIMALRAWARRWARLHPQVREFYARRASDLDDENEPVRVALWRVLQAGEPLDGWQYAQLYALWEDDHGMRPHGLELAPTRLK